MISKRLLIVRGLTLAGIAAVLPGCGGITSGYINASDDDKKVIERGGYSEAAVAQIAIVQHPDFNGGKISKKAFQKVQELSMLCQRQVDPQLAGGGQSALSGAVAYGTAGAVGTGVGASQAFSYAVGAEYAIYGGIASLVPGAVNGLVTGSYAMASAKGTCTVEFWRLTVERDPSLKGTIVIPVLAGKAWGQALPPALDRGAVARPPAPVR